MPREAKIRHLLTLAAFCEMLGDLKRAWEIFNEALQVEAE